MNQNELVNIILNQESNDLHKSNSEMIFDNDFKTDMLLAYGSQMKEQEIFFQFYHYLNEENIKEVKRMMAVYKLPCNQSPELAEDTLAWKQEALYQALLYRELIEQEKTRTKGLVQKRKIRAPRGEY